MENVKVYVAPDQNGVVTILEGKALTPREKRPLLISGEINAISKFLGVRPGNILTDHVIFSRKEMKIEYNAQDQTHLGDLIIGSLSINPELEEFKINQEKMRTTKELASFLKMRRSFFVDKDKCAVIVTELNKFTAKITADIENHSDQRGNARALADLKVSSNIPEEFSLVMPIFVGGKPMSFRVEICIEVTDGAIKCWLESTELKELIIGTRDALIDDEIKKILSIGNYVIIEHS